MIWQVLVVEGYYKHRIRNRNRIRFLQQADATVLNEFAAAAGLFFYALFPDSISQFSEKGERTLEKPLSSHFMDPSMLYFRGKMDGVLR